MNDASAGFTLIELLVVLALIVILASVGLAQYKNSVIYSKQAVLKDDLFKLNEAIDQVLRRQRAVPEQPRFARQRRLHPRHPGRPVHELRELLADGAGGTGPQQSHGSGRHLRREERVGRDRAGRHEVRRLEVMRHA